MPECPECDGEGGREVVTEADRWEGDLDQPPPTTWKDCRFCNGDGEVGALKLATYKTRGVTPPTDIQGYS